jgi:N-acylneuraminate cytidylyltransferase/CMP-N,N'-diacetyllegionaminic acid synthase
MIIGTICTRKGSKGVPNKNMRDMLGWPLIYYTMWCAQKYPFDDLVLYTDDPEIKRYCAPGLWAQTIPSKLTTDTSSKWNVFRYIAEQNDLKPDDILVDLDVGCPLREAQDIGACVEKLGRGNKYDLVATAYESDRNPHFNMVETGGTNYAYVIGQRYRTGKPIVRRQDAPIVYSLSPAVFAIRVSALSEYVHWSESRMGIAVIPRERAWDIDTPLDWDIVEFLMKGKP